MLVARLVCTFSVILLSACASVETQEDASNDQVEQNENTAQTIEETPIGQRIYYFQHKLIPRWVYGSEGAFFQHLYNRNAAQLFQAAVEIVSQEYAEGLLITPVMGRDAVVIRFPEPSEMGDCYYALVLKKGSDFSYITYEKTLAFDSDEFVAVLGGWSQKGSHQNYGIRGYRSEQEFIDDVLGVDAGVE